MSDSKNEEKPCIRKICFVATNNVVTFLNFWIRSGYRLILQLFVPPMMSHLLNEIMHYFDQTITVSH